MNTIDVENLIFKIGDTGKVTHNKLGLMGEWFAYRLLRKLGFQSVTFADGRTDIIANDLRIEVKTARLDKSNRWTYKLSKNDKHGFTDHTNSDYVLLIQILPNDNALLYFIPVAELATHNITMRNTAGKYSGYLNKFVRPKELVF